MWGWCNIVLNWNEIIFKSLRLYDGVVWDGMWRRRMFVMHAFWGDLHPCWYILTSTTQLQPSQEGRVFFAHLSGKLCHLPWNVSPFYCPSCKYGWIDFWNFSCQLYKKLHLILTDRHTRVLWSMLVSFQSPTHLRSTLVFRRRGTALGGEAR